MGLEFREASYLLSSKTERTLKADMVFNLSLGLQNLEDVGTKPYGKIFLPLTS
jgi:nucleosome binding factor SPN SPT16 subunit